MNQSPIGMKSLLMLFLISYSTLFGDELENAPPTILNIEQGPLFVGLGCNCITAGMIRHFGKRQAAFPLDWMLTLDEVGLLQVLSNNFQNFTDKEYLIRHPINGSTWVHGLYHMEFTHDWLYDYWNDDHLCHQELEKLQMKLQKRIARFQQLASYKGTVIFMRLRMPQTHNPETHWFDFSSEMDEREFSLKLHDALKNLFPHLDFKLILVTKTDVQNKVEVFDNITICYFTNVDEHRFWEPLFR